VSSRIGRVRLVGAAVALAIGASASFAAVDVPPRPERYATDKAGVIDASRLSALNERLAQFERDTSNQVLVYVDRRVPPGTTMEEFANAAFNAWGVGQKDKSNGVVLFLFVDDRKFRFEVGYGLEAVIPDARTQQIGEAYLVPRLRAGDVAGAVEQTADQLAKAARGEPFQGTGQTVAESGPTGPLPWYAWLMPIVAVGAGVAVARKGTGLESQLVRFGATAGILIAVISMFGTILAQDPRLLALGFGLLLSGMAVAVPILIGRESSLQGRRRIGLGMVQAASGMLIGGLGLLCLSTLGSALMSLAGYGYAYGVPLMIAGGLTTAREPLRLVTVFLTRLAFLVCLVSAIVLAVLIWLRVDALWTAIDWVVVSGLSWLMLWVFARSRGWIVKVEVQLGGGSTYSSSGRSGGWSSSGSSSWSSSSSGSSFSGGGGRSGGGGSSGSW
jgi:uncharacterized protein